MDNEERKNRGEALLKLSNELERFVSDSKIPENWKVELLGEKYLRMYGSLTTVLSEGSDGNG
jgi:hypothetical protein